MSDSSPATPEREQRRRRRDEPVSYYGQPVLHRPPWRWLIVVYFFLGGIAGASALIAAVAEAVGGPEARRIVRAGRYISLAALLPCPALLVLDLHRPARFYNMLRVLKLRSVMSVGSWLLALFSGLAGALALIQAVRDGLGRATLAGKLALLLPGRLLSGLAGLAGGMFGGYTGVLLGATAVPLWAKSRVWLGPLFLSSAVASAASAIRLALWRPEDHAALPKLERLAAVGLGSELTLTLLAERQLGPEIGKPMHEGRYAQHRRIALLGGGATLLLRLWLAGQRRPHPALSVLAALLTLVGGLHLRYLFVMAGHASADDPQATFAWAQERQS